MLFWFLDDTIHINVHHNIGSEKTACAPVAAFQASVDPLAYWLENTGGVCRQEYPSDGFEFLNVWILLF